MIDPQAPVLRLARIDSTNAEAARRAATGDSGPLWILAERQFAGRGRRGRSWIDAPGNLLCTYLGSTRLPPATIALLGFAAGLALVDACADLGLPEGRAQVKWPNDLLLDAAKAGGVLIDCASLDDGGRWFALGIGLNLASGPTGLDQPTTSLGAALGATPQVELVFAAVRRHLAAWAGQLASAGFAALREPWRRRAAGLGEMIAVDLGGSRARGRFVDLSETGELLFLPAGALDPVCIAAGDIYLAPAAN